VRQIKKTNETKKDRSDQKQGCVLILSRPKSLSIRKIFKQDNPILSAQNFALCSPPIFSLGISFHTSFKSLEHLLDCATLFLVRAISLAIASRVIGKKKVNGAQ
jgi:hypothetical protein